MKTAFGAHCTYTVQFQYNIFFYSTEQVQLVHFARNSKMHYWLLLKNKCLCIIVDKKVANLVS